MAKLGGALALPNSPAYAACKRAWPMMAIGRARSATWFALRRRCKPGANSASTSFVVSKLWNSGVATFTNSGFHWKQYVNHLASFRRVTLD